MTTLVATQPRLSESPRRSKEAMERKDGELVKDTRWVLITPQVATAYLKKSKGNRRIVERKPAHQGWCGCEIRSGYQQQPFSG